MHEQHRRPWSAALSHPVSGLGIGLRVSRFRIWGCEFRPLHPAARLHPVVGLGLGLGFRVWIFAAAALLLPESPAVGGRVMVRLRLNAWSSRD
jgi:hypothetical protein